MESTKSNGHQHQVGGANQFFPSARARCMSPAVSFRCPPPPLPKKSLSFLGMAELVSYKTIPIVGVTSYVSTSVAALTMSETFENWFGSEYAAVNVMNGLTLSSWIGIGCYIYGRRHIRHAGSFEKIIYPAFTTTFFIAASHFSWAFIKDLLREQDCFDYHWRMVAGVSSSLVFLYTGKSYLRFIDHW